MTISKRNGKYYCRFQINGERHQAVCKDCRTLNEARLFEAELIKKGVPLPTVQHIMGHSSIQTTMRYNHNESVDIKNAMNYL